MPPFSPLDVLNAGLTVYQVESLDGLNGLNCLLPSVHYGHTKVDSPRLDLENDVMNGCEEIE